MKNSLDKTPKSTTKNTASSESSGVKKVAGVDVSKEKLDLAICGESTVRQFNNTEKGIESLIDYLEKNNVGYVGVEATGIYHMDMRDSIACKNDIKISVFQPSLVKYYMKSQNRLAKTDKVDSKQIADYTSHMIDKKKIHFCSDDNSCDDKMRALYIRADQLKEDVLREKSRLESTRNDSVKKMIQKNIKRLDSEIKKINDQIIKNLELDDSQKEKFNALIAYQSIGIATAITLMTNLPELGSVNRRQIAALSGLAPYANNSGKKTGKRSIFGGRERVRKALYLAALSAVQHHSVLKSKHEKYKAQGKAPKVSIIACARQLITYINSDLPKRLSSNRKTESEVHEVSVAQLGV